MTTTAAPDVPVDLADNPRLGTWLPTPEGDLVRVRLGKVELGQGIATTLLQILADALGVPLEQVEVLPAHSRLGPDEGATSGSLSTMRAGSALRYVGGAARRLVTELAAHRWEVDPASVSVVDGVVHAGDRWASVASLLAELDPDTDLRTVTPAGGSRGSGVVGMSVPRIDLPDKVFGRARYVGDLRPPGLCHGRVLRPPSVGARLESLDPAAVAALPATVTLVRDGSFVGVVAVGEAEVDRALDAVRAAARWVESESLPDESRLGELLRAGPHEDIPVVADDPAPEPAERTLRASYSRPFLAHASIGPSTALARWDGDRVLVRSHTQGVFPLARGIADALGLDVAQVTVEHAEHAGCYGHNGADDAAFDAVLLARAVPGVPVRVRWSRADELAWSPLSSAMAVDVEADLRDGRIVGWRYDVFSQGHTSRPGYAGSPGLLAAAHLAEPVALPPAVDPPVARGAGTARNARPLYDVGPQRITGHRLTRTALRTSALRSLGAFTNVFAIESFIDELADVVGADPLAFRLAHLQDPRARAVLTTAADAAGWGTPLPDGLGRGLGLARYKDRGAYCAVVAEVALDHEVHVRRLVSAVDVGLVVNPDGVRNQIEGGAVQSTSWTLRERVRFDRRRVLSDDWESYPVLRFGEVPRVEVHLVDRPDEPSVGAGEAVQGPTAAAIANAVHDAIGVRVRDLPLTREAIVAAIDRDA